MATQRDLLSAILYDLELYKGYDVTDDEIADRLLARGVYVDEEESKVRDEVTTSRIGVYDRDSQASIMQNLKR